MEKYSNNIFKVETFDEFPDGYIVIDNKSSYFFITHLNKSYVAIQKIDLATIVNINGNDKMLCKKSYYNVANGEFILSEKCIYDLDNNYIIFTDTDYKTKITPLDNYLKLPKGFEKYLYLDEVEDMTNSNCKSYKKINSYSK